MDNFEREPLRPGDIVVYDRPEHESNGSVAVVRSSGQIYGTLTVDVDWITAIGIVQRLDPNRYGQRCFRKIGSLSDGSVV